jgi:alpha-1,2-glucosyltransferase
VFALRLTSFVALNVNLYLIFKIRALYAIDHIVPVGEVLAIASLPPMYLFGHLYYTDVLSITTVLAMMLAALRQRHGVAAICGAFSVLVRQTNIVWLGMFFGMSVFNIVVRETLAFRKGKAGKGLAMKESTIEFSVSDRETY